MISVLLGGFYNYRGDEFSHFDLPREISFVRGSSNHSYKVENCTIMTTLGNPVSVTQYIHIYYFVNRFPATSEPVYIGVD